MVFRPAAATRFLRTLGLGAVCLLSGFIILLVSQRDVEAQESAQAARIDFARQIRPILSENCFFCHGQDPNTREADLRLDLAEGAGTVLSKGQPEHSELIRRIISKDSDELMPPPESNRGLSARQIELLKEWVRQGAVWNDHWSFRPLDAPEVPPGPLFETVPVRNPVDAFIQGTLAAKGLRPAAESDRRTLIRRVTLDLTGLPPTDAEVAEFLDDRSPEAYERVVDRLLKSPAYGERMAWNWLDAARYADSNGYQGDRERTMWPWRDWVVDSFNRNLPYDQFTLWQIAGDLLPDATFEQKLATGFLRNHMINGEGGRIPEENRVDYVFDMSETVGTVWLGLTLNCCRCHDHKYDPLTRRDYYSMFAFFNQTPVTGAGGDPQTQPVLPVPTAAQRRQLDQLDRELSELEMLLATRRSLRLDQRAQWESQLLTELTKSTWQPLHPAEWKAEVQTLKLLPDQSLLAGGSPADQDTYTVVFEPDEGLTVGSLRIDALRHESLNANSLARSDSGNFVLTDVAIRLLSPNQVPRELKIVAGVATFEQGQHKIANVWDSDPKSGWAVYEGRLVDRDHACVLQLETPVTLKADDRIEIRLSHQSPHVQHNLGRFRISSSPDQKAGLDRSSPELIAALRTPVDQRTSEQVRAADEAVLSADSEFVRIRTSREQRKQSRDALQASLPKVMVMADLESPRKTFLLDRGLYNKPADEVSAAVPASLPGLPEGVPNNRLGLARWLIDPENPLTARVTVNRFWQQVFGVGLVKTTEDFGAQGEIPEQMELLNWLAADFRDHGWDVKRLMRMLVTSHTYRQTSRVSEADYRDDPENRLLARGSRFRMPSWMIRDAALSASGLLVPRVGGPPVNGYQPPNVWEEATFGKKSYQQDHGEALYRRSLYTFWRRIVAPTMFFDVASRQTCTVKTVRTNTPLHALLTLNDVQYVEAARQLAQTTLQHHGWNDHQRLAFVFRRILAREPATAEADLLLTAVARSRGQYEQHPDQARQLLAIGEFPRDETLDPAEHAGWTALCLAVLNLDEALTKE